MKFIHCLYSLLFCLNISFYLVPSHIKVIHAVLQQHNLFTLTYNNTTTYCLIALPELHNTDSFFETCALKLPTIFDHLAQEKKTLIITVPTHYHLIGPLDQHAPYHEGIRVAMAWASAFYRFKSLGSLDVRFLLLPEHFKLEELFTICVQLAQQKIEDDMTTSPEYRLEKRQFSYQDSAQQLSLDPQKITIQPLLNDYTVEPYKHLFSHSLPALQPGQRRILVTGGAGFIGSHLTEQLLEKGHQVIVLDNLFCCSPNNLEKVIDHKNLYFIEGDVTQPFTIAGTVTDIMHVASLPSPQFYYSYPYETLTTGLHGTKNCLELAREKNARFLFTSTSEVYGDPLINPQPEDYPGNVNPIGKRSQYDQSKRGAETLIKLYYEKYKIDVRILRIFNTYGPHMMLNDGRVITNFIQALLENKPLIINGDGTQTRSFAYGDDTVDGIIRIFESEHFDATLPITERVFNVGNNTEFTINELAEKMNTLSQKYFDRPASIVYQEQPDKTDPKQRRPDLNRITKKVCYLPKITLDEGLEYTLQYFMQKTIAQNQLPLKDF